MMNTSPDALPIDETAAPERYRSLSWPAILSLAVGMFSILTVFHPVFWAVPLLAAALGWYALRQIQSAPGEYTGEAFAWGGIAAAAALGLLGFGIYHYVETHSIPAGYTPVTFDDLQSATEIIPPSAYDLEPTSQDREKRIYITGYMYPGRRNIKIREFVLVPTLGHCQFCSRQLKSTEMISVKFTGDLTTDYTDSLVKVGGKFRIDREQVATPLGGLPYQLEADFFQE
ncbi:MAG: hypothetical protein JXB10_08665 [Pirellulales bacterium]|nr:hypothetical protein [Pirellulales bacterium]